MTHPHLLHRAEALEEAVLLRQVQIRPAPFAPAMHDRAAVMFRYFLVAEAEPHDRHVQVVDLFRVARRFSV